MANPQHTAVDIPHRLRTARVLRVEEHACEVFDGGGAVSVAFAPMFPAPRVERVSPGQLVAVAEGPGGVQVVVWRWYDAVVLGSETDGSVRLWEPAHGEVLARARASYTQQSPGSRAYASAGLAGAEWWVAARVTDRVEADVELDEVDALYAENGLWAAAFEVTT